MEMYYKNVVEFKNYLVKDWVYVCLMLFNL